MLLFARVCQSQQRSDLDSSNCIYLFNEQYIVKPPKTPNSWFAWHQDMQEQMTMMEFSSAQPLPKYVSVWIPLDDISEKNGPLWVLPLSATRRMSYLRQPCALSDPEILTPLCDVFV